MLSSSLVSLEPLHGVARLGTVTVAIAPAGSHGELQVGGETGPIVRPLTIGERNPLVWQAIASTTPQQTVWLGLRALAIVSQNSTAGVPIADCVLDVIALTLAGGLWDSAPPLDRTMTVVANETGWSPQQLAEAIALEVDQLALALEESQKTVASPDNGWKRFVLLSPEESDLGYIRDQLTHNLLSRGEGAPKPEDRQTGRSPSSMFNLEDAAEQPVNAAPAQPSPPPQTRVVLRQFVIHHDSTVSEAPISPEQPQHRANVRAVDAQAIPQDTAIQRSERPVQPPEPALKRQRFSTRSVSVSPASLPHAPFHPIGQAAETTDAPTHERPLAREALQSSILPQLPTLPALSERVISVASMPAIATVHSVPPSARPVRTTDPSPLPTPDPPAPTPPLPTDMADALATLLHHEADLRGIPR